MRVVESLPRERVVSAIGRKASQHLPDSAEIEVLECQPAELLTPQRLDLAVKAQYVSWRARGIESSFARNLYLDHIKAFNWFVEADESGKAGPRDFLGAFDEVIDSVQTHGLRSECLIPVSRDGVILDGAHRVAACLYFGLPVRVVRTLLQTGPKYDAEFFDSRGFTGARLDAAIAAYVGRNPDTRIVLLWPTGEGRDRDALSIIARHVRIVGKREVSLSNEGPVHLVIRAYESEPWLGSSRDDFAGARNKARWCFQGEGPVRVVVVESREDLSACKAEIRSLYDREKHSVHISDNHPETVKLSRLLFNSNSLHFMNRAPVVTPSWFTRLFQRYDDWLAGLTETEQEKFCLDGSSVLAAYGLRDVRDLDYLYVGDRSTSSGIKEVSLHNEAAHYYQRTLDDIVFNPEAHFFFRDRKMVAAHVLIEMKESRCELKDRDDVAMLDALLAGSPTRLPISYRMRRVLHPTYVKGRLKLWALKARYHVTVLRRRRRRRN